MRPNLQSRTRKAKRVGLFTAFILLQSLLIIVTPAAGQQLSEWGLEVIVTDAATKPVRLIGHGPHGAVSRLINRESLRITDPSEAGNFTAVEVTASIEEKGIRVSLSLIYNDLTNPEWWKDKKEKMACSYLLQDGETSQAICLEEFGIAPFTMTVLSGTPVVIKPGEGPRIINNTTSLKVERLEKWLDSYSITLKNISSKDIAFYGVLTGNVGISSFGSGIGARALAAGSISQPMGITLFETGLSNITIPAAVFADGTFEGDKGFALKFLASREGMKAQAPHVLHMIEHTMTIDDSDIRFAFTKLESDLWLIPEALFKPEALHFLQLKYPDQDEKTILALYENFKGGLYDARNIALRSIGDTLRTVMEYTERGQYATAAELIRRCLNRLKEDLTQIASQH